LFVGDLPVVQQGDKDLELLLTYMYPWGPTPIH
jgi:hypothetical protein